MVLQPQNYIHILQNSLTSPHFTAESRCVYLQTQFLEFTIVYLPLYTIYTALPADFLGTRVDTAVSKDQMAATLLQLLRFYFLPRLQYNTAGHLIGPEDSNTE